MARVDGCRRGGSAVSPQRHPGILIACDGTRGSDVRDDVARLLRYLRGHGVAGAVSRWDGSGLFEELQVSKRRRRRLSPRSLLLLYAADMAFRVRWEIEPAIAQGRVVIAAPYVATAVALGAAAGLSPRWVEAILRFAPQPAVSVCVRERKQASGWTAKPLSGFAEFCATTLGGGSQRPDATVIRRSMISSLDALVNRRRAVRLDRHIVGRVLP